MKLCHSAPRSLDKVEGLKTNNEIKGLSRYVNDHVLKVLEKKDQMVIKILECLGREGDFDEDDLFFAMRK